MAPVFIWEIEAYNIPLIYNTMSWRTAFLPSWDDWGELFDSTRWDMIKSDLHYKFDMKPGTSSNLWWLK